MESRRWAESGVARKGRGDSRCTMGWRDTLGVSNPSARPDYTAQGSSTGKIKPHYLCLQKPVRAGTVEKTARFSPLKGPAWS